MAEKLLELTNGKAALSLCDIAYEKTSSFSFPRQARSGVLRAWNRNGRPTQLRDKSELLLLRKARCKAVDIFHEIHGLLPNSQFLVVYCHSYSPTAAGLSFPTSN